MIRFEDVTVVHPGRVRPVLRGVDLEVPEGDLCLVVGPTGSGKSTLLGTVNGHVPHATGSALSGRVLVGDRDTRLHPPRDLADLVGVVGQDPAAGFVTDHVEDELAFVTEQLATPPEVMRKRVEEVLDLLGIAHLRDRPLATLSGGEQQRVAIGSVLTASPRVLVLDEPTSSLDPTAAEEVLATVLRLVHDLGITALVAEHRLERIAHYADSVLHLPGDGGAELGPPGPVLARASVAPPVVELGRALGWTPPPTSVRDARRAAAGLRDVLGRAPLPAAPPAGPAGDDPALLASGVTVRHGDLVALAPTDLRLDRGEVLALMGRNGAGKTSLLWALQGTGPRTAGHVRVRGEDPATLDPGAARCLVGLVPQVAADLLYLPTVGEELARADEETGSARGSARELLDGLLAGLDDATHPRDLSEGQRLALALAVQLVAAPAVVLLDEPTRGLDPGAKRALAATLRRLADAGHAVVLSTHDVEVAAVVADRVVVLAEGEVVSDGPARQVLTASPAFAPQVAKVVAPHPWLTVEEVVATLDGGSASGPATDRRADEVGS